MTFMLVIEPSDCFQRRVAEQWRRTEAFLHQPPNNSDAWTGFILSYLSARDGEPVKVTALINDLGKGFRPRSRLREAKTELLHAISRLIRTKRIGIHRRRFLMLSDERK